MLTISNIRFLLFLIGVATFCNIAANAVTSSLLARQSGWFEEAQYVQPKVCMSPNGVPVAYIPIGEARWQWAEREREMAKRMKELKERVQ